MRLGEFYNDKELTDALPPPGAGVRTPTTPTIASPQQQNRQQTLADPNLQRDLAAQQMQDRAHEKKTLQDQIRFKQKELESLKKRLSDIN